LSKLWLKWMADEIVGGEAVRSRHQVGWWLRLSGLGLLAVLLTRVDLSGTVAFIWQADIGLVVAATGLLLPMIGLKTIRWRLLLTSQQIAYGVVPAFLAYLGSIFIGFLTPGRLGEFVKALHVAHDCRISIGRSLSGVLADRLFDFYMLVAIALHGLLSVAPHAVGQSAELSILILAGGLSLSLFVFWLDAIYYRVAYLGRRLGAFGERLFSGSSWLVQMRLGLKQVSPSTLAVATLLTILAYVTLFLQAYLLATALGMSADFWVVTYAMAIGSVVTLLPISVSGLGTREAAVVAFLGIHGVPAELALGFSLLVFATFYVASGVLGAIAWWLKPMPLAATIRRWSFDAQ